MSTDSSSKADSNLEKPQKQADIAESSTQGNSSSPESVQSNENVALGSATATSPSSSSSSSSSSLGTSTKSHKVEGKNKKSLHQKRQQANLGKQQQQQQQATQVLPSSSSNGSHSSFGGSNAITTNRRGQKNGQTGKSNSVRAVNLENSKSVNNKCTTLEDFSKKALEIKAQINEALEKQAAHYQIIDQPVEVVQLKDDILKLSGMNEHNQNNAASDSVDTKPMNELNSIEEGVTKGEETAVDNDNTSSRANQTSKDESVIVVAPVKVEGEESSQRSYKSDINLNQALDNMNLDGELQQNNQQQADNGVPKQRETSKSSKSNKNAASKRNQTNAGHTNSAVSESDKLKQPLHQQQDSGFEPLGAKLDCNSKVIALVSSLQKHFNDTPHLLEAVCRKLVKVSEQNEQLKSSSDRYQSENEKLLLIKQKLENLCRELQKSNNAIRIESLDLIKVEQSKAKEQTTKIQSTLSGVIKLFDDNQQRNMSLRQENQDLQTKLKSLLDHCDNWEKSVEAALRQRDIENRLIKTELAKANLLKNEEKEKFLGEKQELLQILSMMQEQQHRIEGQEAKLRSDLSSYASKYDECQAVISKGMNRFQTESKKMLKQIERSKQDYQILLSKYESSNRRMAQLLEEKQSWDKAMNVANKKIITLEKLCRALKERKAEDSQ